MANTNEHSKYYDRLTLRPEIIIELRFAFAFGGPLLLYRKIADYENLQFIKDANEILTVVNAASKRKHSSNHV